MKDEEIIIVRRRPAAYLGGTGAEALHHLIRETVRVISDPACHNGASRVTVELYAGNVVTVRDDGVGLPVDAVATDGIVHPRLELVLTGLRDPNLPDGAHLEWGFLLKWGAILNAMCSRLLVLTIRDGREYRMTSARGGITTLLARTERAPNDDERGTTLSFRPDPDLFGLLRVEPQRVESDLVWLRAQFHGASIEFRDVRDEDCPW